MLFIQTWFPGGNCRYSAYPDYASLDSQYAKPNVKPRKSTSSQDVPSVHDTSRDMYDTSRDVYDASRDPVPQHVSFDDQVHQDEDDQPRYVADPYGDPRYYRPAPLPPDSQV